ncbi:MULTISPECIES: glycosyltransferase [unclassified Cryobacterium]|uniref:glycosyltransferase n=1 Tax=unclassified Cryobacterium TaxID=2649013 RepID=UPI002AB3298B|nr:MULTISPECIES: glycosyltransferase [unclassified Cryobacterium]MDY7542784.1 glycosyltransferase [Cryobacterium sp. 5B3]MEB0264843.1 glycosyltransferase [Cryobacterium sp. 10I5]MEB0273986.1 glycosyltransferase [Cryobacterium sp. 5B3]
MPNQQQGVVSVILVNFRGTDDTIEAIRQLGELDWPAERLEIIVVENASGDDSLARLRSAVPQVTLVESKKNLGFAGGCNLGVRQSSGEFVAFLNNDAKPDPGWIRAAVARFDESQTIGAVASRVLDWDGKLVDYIGSAMTWFGQGYKPLTAQSIPAEADRVHDVLFGTGSAMFVRRSVYDALGGFDERFFMFFEDVDFGWRLNLRGWRYVYEPASLAYHKHHASMSSFGSFKETYLLERNALFTQYKNLGSEALARMLPATLALAVRRAVSRGDLDSTSFDLRKGGDNDPLIEISRESVAGVFAIDQFVENLPSLTASREEIQSSRVVADNRIWELFGEVDAPSYQSEHYLEGYDKIATAFGVTESPEVTRVLVITGDPIGAKMAGPAIRAWNIAEALSKKSVVTLVSLAGVEAVSAPFDVVHVRPGDDRAMRNLEAASDVIVFQGLAMALFDSLRTSKKIIVADVYDPMHLEQLEQGRELGKAQWDRQVTDATEVLNEQLSRGDFFLCASERQRQFYLGQLAALGRVNPANYANDPDLTHLICVVPFGLNEVFPAETRPVLKGVLPGIGREDKVLLWSGGLYNWFDPKTLIRAVSKVGERHDNVRLFFQGTKHPHPGVPEMGIVAESRALASELGALDRSVFFNPSWVDYSDRHNFLGEADAGVSTHFVHVETTFSFRTRILDYLWAGLPMVVTEGDHFAELIAREQLGVVVPPEDATALAAAIEKVLFDEDFIRAARVNIDRVRSSYEWGTVLAPLVAFVEHPVHAPDLIESGVVGAGDGSRKRAPKLRRKKHGIRHDVGLFVHYLNAGGPRVVIKKIRSRIRHSR